MFRGRLLMTPVLGSIFPYLTREPYPERKLSVKRMEERGKEVSADANKACSWTYRESKFALR